MSHWASMLRWIWSISECNLTIRDSLKRTPMGGPFSTERRGSGPEKQQPKHNPCWPVGRNWRKPIVLTSGRAGKIRHLLTVCLTKVHTIGWNPNGVWTWSDVPEIDITWFLLGGIAHHKHWPQNMCYTHSWPQQRWYFENYSIFILTILYRYECIPNDMNKARPLFLV